eukprot:TRINITY_DN7664_c0_g1_i1.p1 TRINITY_DN7664_c0_g1~~TRINITY_DN7664_c0_g1_i1.p1  ORF type:complete len:322 (+),score=153.32 TRINITY_DN7664_c0_g1_i1:30-995(+)
MSSNVAKLHTGQELPQIGLGTWQAKPGEVGKAVAHAIEHCGYRHIDCASVYLNEDEIGDTFADLFKRGVVQRKDLFITSKLYNPYHRREHVRDMCLKTLKDLGLEYLDLYLIHWPVAFKFVPYDKERRGFDKSYDPNLGNLSAADKFDSVPIRETWEAMEALVEEGLVKAIGVSNFASALIHDLLTYAKIKPAVNQVENHPYLQQGPLVKYCQSKGIVIEAYSPLGTPGVKGASEPTVLEDPILNELAKKYSRSVAQIALRWQIQRGVVALPKSVTPSRIQENFSVSDFELSQEDFDKITSIDRKYRFLNPDDWYQVPLFG